MTGGDYDSTGDFYYAETDEPYYEDCMFSISGYYCMDTNGEYIGAPVYDATTGGDDYSGDEDDVLFAGYGDYTDYVDSAYDYFSDFSDYFADTYSGFDFRRQLQSYDYADYY